MPRVNSQWKSTVNSALALLHYRVQPGSNCPVYVHDPHIFSAFSSVEGAELLVGYKLNEKAPTQRFVASCCNSGMFIKFAPGFWISTYRMRFAEPLPTIEMRNKVERRQSDLPLPADAPAYQGFPAKLFWRLITARFAMLTGR